MTELGKAKSLGFSAIGFSNLSREHRLDFMGFLAVVGQATGPYNLVVWYGMSTNPCNM